VENPTDLRALITSRHLCTVAILLHAVGRRR
jgi:hypothetical protein